MTPRHDMTESWDDHADQWDAGAPVLYADAAVASLREELARNDITLQGARILDFGCGTGLLSERLAPDVGSIVGLDPSAGMIARLREKIEAGLGVQAIEGTLDALAPQAPFDLIVASSVCAFLDDYPGTLARLASLLSSGGVFCQWDWEYDATDEDPFGLTREAISRALADAGLEVLHVDTAFEVLFGEMTMRPLMGMGRQS